MTTTDIFPPSPVLQSQTAVRLSDTTVFDILTFTVLVLGAVSFKSIGNILLSDIIIIPLAIAGVFARGLPNRRLAHFSVAGAALWVLSLVVSDIINSTALNDLIRGWARNGLAFFYLVFFLCALRPTLRSLTVFAAGISIALLLRLMQMGLHDTTNLMKFGGGVAVTWIVCAAAMWEWRAGRWLFCWSILLFWVGVSLAENVRSIMTVDFLALGLMAASRIVRWQLRRLSVPTLLVCMLAAGTVVGGGLSAIYNAAASNGTLGHAAEEKYNIQSRGGGVLDQIWNARPEERIALRSISSSPIIGHGSWYKDINVVAAEMLFSNYVSGGSIEVAARTIIENGGVQAVGHSIVLQAWVEAGIIGVTFWLWVIGVCVASLIRTARYPTVLSPLLFFAASMLIWDSLFSAFGDMQRVVNLGELAVVLIAGMPSGDLSRSARSGNGGNFGRVKRVDVKRANR